jgi:hypothetical protein
MKSGKIHVLVRFAFASTACYPFFGSDFRSVYINRSALIDRSEILKHYAYDQCFEPVVRALRNEWPNNEHVKRLLERMVPFFSTDNDGCLFIREGCVFPAKVNCDPKNPRNLGSNDFEPSELF